MISAPNMILLGAAGRNVGKTEFACRLIQRYAPLQTVMAIKITTVDKGMSCPRGGAGCGVCGALTEPFCITEETEIGGGKDTMRMKAAGAHQVLWLRVLREHLQEGVVALMDRIPAGVCIVCESNSARRVMEPGAFLVIHDPGQEAIKESCAIVRHLADLEMGFHGDHWDLDPDKCRFEDGRWHLPLLASAAVLAGGQSLRMGQDKSFLDFQGKPLIQHIVDQLLPEMDEVVIGANDASKFAFTGLPVISDETPGQGPLMGILSCLQAAKHDRVFITACDIPELPVPLIREMLQRAGGADVVIPRHLDGQLEPLLAVYRKGLAPIIRRCLEKSQRRIIAILEEPGLRVDFVDMPKGDWYRNLNTPEEYQNAVSQ